KSTVPAAAPTIPTPNPTLPMSNLSLTPWTSSSFSGCSQPEPSEPHLSLASASSEYASGVNTANVIKPAAPNPQPAYAPMRNGSGPPELESTVGGATTGQPRLVVGPDSAG